MAFDARYFGRFSLATPFSFKSIRIKQTHERKCQVHVRITQISTHKSDERDKTKTFDFL